MLIDLTKNIVGDWTWAGSAIADWSDAGKIIKIPDDGLTFNDGVSAFLDLVPSSNSIVFGDAGANQTFNFSGTGLMSVGGTINVNSDLLLAAGSITAPLTGVIDFGDDDLVTAGGLSLGTSLTIDNQAGPDADINFRGTSAFVGLLRFETDNNRFAWNNNFKMVLGSQIQFRNLSTGIYSQADTFLDLFADGAVRIGDSQGGAPTNFISISATGNLLFNGTAGMAFGEIYAQDNVTETAVTTAGKVNKVQITIFDTNGQSNNTTPDHANDHITITKAGKYLVTVSMSVESSAGDGDLLAFSCYKNDGATELANLHFHRDFTAGASFTGSASMSGIIDLAVDDTLEVWGWNETDTDNFLIEDITLSILQIGG